MNEQFQRVALNVFVDLCPALLELEVRLRVVTALEHTATVACLRRQDAGRGSSLPPEHRAMEVTRGHVRRARQTRENQRQSVHPHGRPHYNRELAPIEVVQQRAGSWFLHSGIQESNGGVARYYLAAENKNLPVSSEITGYAASALAYLYKRTGNQSYLDAAVRAASFLDQHGWDSAANTFPFEPGSDRAYFFDLGIIARGLMAVYRATGEERFRSRAQDAALSLGFDFLGDNCFYPVISVPMKEPLPEEPRWSRKPGCFQLKSALIWREMDDEHAQRMFDVALAISLATHESFLDDANPEKVMDRLHAYSYFLEALLAATEHDEAKAALAWGLDRAGTLLRQIAPTFERSDVSAQILRVRLAAHYIGAVPLNEALASDEAQRAASFQAESPDSHLNGGFWFGRKGAETLPFANPVSTAFCTQALTLWDDHQRGQWNFQLTDLI